MAEPRKCFFCSENGSTANPMKDYTAPEGLEKKGANLPPKTVFIHDECRLWLPDPDLVSAVHRAWKASLKCAACKKGRAMHGCMQKRCQKSFHFRCCPGKDERSGSRLTFCKAHNTDECKFDVYRQNYFHESPENRERIVRILEEDDPGDPIVLRHRGIVGGPSASASAAPRSSPPPGRTKAKEKGPAVPAASSSSARDAASSARAAKRPREEPLKQKKRPRRVSMRSSLVTETAPAQPPPQPAQRGDEGEEGEEDDGGYDAGFDGEGYAEDGQEPYPGPASPPAPPAPAPAAIPHRHGPPSTSSSTVPPPPAPQGPSASSSFEQANSSTRLPSPTPQRASLAPADPGPSRRAPATPSASSTAALLAVSPGVPTPQRAPAPPAVFVAVPARASAPPGALVESYPGEGAFRAEIAGYRNILGPVGAEMLRAASLAAAAGRAEHARAQKESAELAKKVHHIEEFLKEALGGDPGAAGEAARLGATLKKQQEESRRAAEATGRAAALDKKASRAEARARALVAALGPGAPQPGAGPSGAPAESAAAAGASDVLKLLKAHEDLERAFSALATLYKIDVPRLGPPQ
eukprot:tig00020904_g15256.t1